jgi:hypothetical protein
MPHSTSPIGKDIQDGGYELPRIYIPRTPVNKPVHTFGAHSSQLVATKSIRLGDALGAYGCYLFRARERKDKIVGTIAEPCQGALWLPILRTL